jgi:hypothetical protein
MFWAADGNSTARTRVVAFSQQASNRRNSSRSKPTYPDVGGIPHILRLRRLDLAEVGCANEVTLWEDLDPPPFLVSSWELLADCLCCRFGKSEPCEEGSYKLDLQTCFDQRDLLSMRGEE